MTQRTKSAHEQAFYWIEIEQLTTSRLNYQELRDAARSAFGKVTRSFVLLDSLDHDKPVSTPPPNRYRWRADVKPLGHRKKFSKLVREMALGHTHFRAEAKRCG